MKNGEFGVFSRLCTMVVLGVLLLLPCLAFADGQGRPATQAEKDYHARVLQVFAKALPPAPEGWQTSRQTEIRIPEVVGEGCEANPMPVEYEILWEDAARRDEAMEAMTQAGVQVLQKEAATDSATDSAGNLAGNSAKNMEAAYTALADELGKAADAGDHARVQSLTAELEAMAQKMRAVYEKCDQELQAAMQEHEVRDIRASVFITTNRFSEHMSGSATEGEPVAGCKTVRHEGYRDPHYGWAEGSTYIFMGHDWGVDAGQEPAAMTAQVKPDVPHTEIQTIIVRIQASPERTEELISGMDWEALAALLGSR